MRALRLGIPYFAIVFGAGFALGVVRTLWLVPRLGEATAELVELPVMLVVVVLAARWRVNRERELTPRQALAGGLLALSLLLVFELTVVLGLRGLTLGDYVATREPLPFALYLVSLALCGLLPWLLVRFRVHSEP